MIRNERIKGKKEWEKQNKTKHRGSEIFHVLLLLCVTLLSAHFFSLGKATTLTGGFPSAGIRGKIKAVPCFSFSLVNGTVLPEYGLA